MSDRASSGLRMYNWPDYIAAETMTSFAISQVLSQDRVAYDDTMTDNDELLGQLRNGLGDDWDIVCPTYWVLPELIGLGLVERLALELIPNASNLDPALLRQPVDRGSRFSLPWQSGITGIATNTSKVPAVRSVNELLTRADLLGRVAVLSDQRDSLGLVMLSLGLDPSDTTLGDAQAAAERLKRAVTEGQVVKFADNEQYLDGLRSGAFLASMAWSGDVVQLRDEDPAFEFHVAEEGGMLWYDAMVMPKGCRHPATAAAFMNFVYDPVVAAAITAEVKFISPVLGVQDALDALGADAAALASNPLVFPDDATRRRLHTWHGTTTSDDDVIEGFFGAITP